MATYPLRDRVINTIVNENRRIPVNLITFALSEYLFCNNAIRKIYITFILMIYILNKFISSRIKKHLLYINVH